MKFTFLIDANLPDRLVYVFRSAGHEARHVRRMKLLTDDSIWNASLELNAVIVTQDSDFLAYVGRNQRTRVILDSCGNRPFERIILEYEKVLPDLIVGLGHGERLIEIT